MSSIDLSLSSKASKQKNCYFEIASFNRLRRSTKLHRTIATERATHAMNANIKQTSIYLCDTCCYNFADLFEYKTESITIEPFAHCTSCRRLYTLHSHRMAGEDAHATHKEHSRTQWVWSERVQTKWQSNCIFVFVKTEMRMSTTWRRTNWTIRERKQGFGGCVWRKKKANERQRKKINYFVARWENAYSCDDLRCIHLQFTGRLVSFGLSFVQFLANKYNFLAFLLLHLCGSHISRCVQAHFAVNVN